MSTTIHAIFRETVAAYSAKDALLVKEEGRWRAISYREFHDQVTNLASALLELGVGPGERVAVMSENRPEWLVVDQAVLSLGAVLVPIYTTLTAEQVRYILGDSGAMLCFASSEALIAKVQAVRGDLPALQHVFAFDEVPNRRGQAKVRAWRDLLEAGAEARERTEHHRAERTAQITPEWLASIVYTSGTTGEPKGAMLSHGNFAANALAVTKILDISYQDTTLSFLPLSHVLERMAYYVAVLKGATIAFAESLDKLTVNLTEVRPTYLACVPRVLEKIHDRVLQSLDEDNPWRKEIFLLAQDVGEFYHRTMEEYGRVPFPTNVLYDMADKVVFSKLREKLGGRIRFILVGGAPLPKEVGEFFRNAGIPVVEGYGLTETAPVIALNPPERPRFGTVGKPVEGVTVQLAADGEVLCKGPNVMEGYWHKAEATREAIDAEGWFHTGDVGRFDADGYLSIVDRKKELIVMSNGKKVAPQPVENALRLDSLVDQAMLVGDGRNYITALLVPSAEGLRAWAARRGLAGTALEDLVGQPEVRAHFDQVVAGVNAKAATFEQIKSYTLIPEEWTVESGEISQKHSLRRKVIAERYRDRIDALYTGPQPVISERVAVHA
ncbi:MAG: long-chain fatty acid--CoA ligase [Candidatus Sericytochromatia bacterium]|nr:long-chain fatty acid--CoA ligase [Candidatus Tanganyikabacteria bacterium]